MTGAGRKRKEENEEGKRGRSDDEKVVAKKRERGRITAAGESSGRETENTRPEAVTRTMQRKYQSVRFAIGLLAFTPGV